MELRWQELAACSGMSIDLFFAPENIGGPRTGKGIPGERDRVELAKEICGGCAVQKDCLEFAIERGCVGIFGGMDTGERNDYARKR